MTHHKDGLLVVPKTATVKDLSSPKLTGSLHHERQHGDLFPNAPQASDVKQGGLGDCYLLSAVIAILNCPGGPQAIEECFLDRRSGMKGEIIVRLYDKACAAQYFKIHKTVADVGAVGAVWIKLLEKTYAALYGAKSYDGLTEIAGKEHGRSGDVFRAILGPHASSFDCAQNDQGFMLLMALTSSCRMGNTIADVRQLVFGGDDELLGAWQRWFTDTKYGAWSKIVGNSKIYRLEDFIEFLNTVGRDLPAEVYDYLVAWINHNGILPGRRGTGWYSAPQLHLYDEIAGALGRKEAVAAGTRRGSTSKSKKIPKGNPGAGRPLTGLLPEHQYAVLNVKQEDDMLWLQLHNPWGKWGVTYERGVYAEGPKQGRKYVRPRYDATAGTFWIELSDFAKHFDKGYVGGKALA